MKSFCKSICCIGFFPSLFLSVIYWLSLLDQMGLFRSIFSGSKVTLTVPKYEPTNYSHAIFQFSLTMAIIFSFATLVFYFFNLEFTTKHKDNDDYLEFTTKDKDKNKDDYDYKDY